MSHEENHLAPHPPRLNMPEDLMRPVRSPASSPAPVRRPSGDQGLHRSAELRDLNLRADPAPKSLRRTPEATDLYEISKTEFSKHVFDLGKVSSLSIDYFYSLMVM